MSFLVLVKFVLILVVDDLIIEVDIDGISRIMDIVIYINIKWFSKLEYGFKIFI